MMRRACAWRGSNHVGVLAQPLARAPVSSLSPATMGRHSRFLNMAAVAAEQSPLETKHGSLLVRGGKIIGSGCNSDRSRVQNVPGDSNIISLHSEVRGRSARAPV